MAERVACRGGGTRAGAVGAFELALEVKEEEEDDDDEENESSLILIRGVSRMPAGALAGEGTVDAQLGLRGMPP